MSDRPYLFYELTNSLCAVCLRKVEAKVVMQDGNSYLHKWRPVHRFQKTPEGSEPKQSSHSTVSRTSRERDCRSTDALIFKHYPSAAL